MIPSSLSSQTNASGYVTPIQQPSVSDISKYISPLRFPPRYFAIIQTPKTKKTVSFETIPSFLQVKILKLLPGQQYEGLSLLNKSWYALIKERPFIKRIVEFQGKAGRYQIIYNPRRHEGAAILEQTGYEISFSGKEEKVDHTIGKGCFGTVRLGKRLGNNSQKIDYFAIKIIQGNAGSEAENRIQEELSNLPFIMPALDHYESQDAAGNKTLYLVMPLAGYENFEKLNNIFEKLDPIFHERLLFYLFEKYLEGLKGMHELGYLHLDLKPGNVVLDKDGPRIADFGCSMASANGVIDAKCTMGDANYFSPERWWSFSTQGLATCDGKKVDIWATGLIFYEMAKKAPHPFPFSQVQSDINSFQGNANELKEYLKKYFRKGLDKIEELKKPPIDSLWNLIKNFLDSDPSKRFTAADALNHFWFIKMRAESKNWMDDIKSYLHELVQSKRENSVQDSNVLDSFPMTLSPRDLPHAHFAAHIVRQKLVTVLEKRLLDASHSVNKIVCQGMGGVGKTQLALYMLHHPAIKKRFKGNRFFFRGADQAEMLKAQHILLAKELRLIDDKASVEEAVKRLHQYFSSMDMPWLAIYDNADDPQILKPYLPKEEGCVLITTRSNLWPETIAIDVFAADEAEALVKKLLQNEDLEAQTLGKELGYLPLGIVQACAYIRNQKISIAEYLKKLRQTIDPLDKNEPIFGKIAPASIMALWKISFEALEKSCPEALVLLHSAAYLAPDVIPKAILAKIASPKAFEETLRYALMQSTNLGITMHRLVQQVLRNSDTLNQKITALQISLNGVNQTYAFKPEAQTLRDQNKELVGHGEILIKHCDSLSSFPKTMEAPFAYLLRWNADLQGELGQPHVKKELLEKGLPFAQNSYGIGSANEADFLNDLGEAWDVLGDAKKAKVYFESSQAINLKVQGKDHPSVANNLNNLGMACLDLGDIKESIKFFKSARSIFEKHLGKQDLELANVINNLAVAAKQLGNYPKAIKYYDQALSVAEKGLGPEHPIVTAILNNLAIAYKEYGKPQKALELFRQVLAIDEKIYGNKHPSVALDLNNLAETLRELGNSREALELHERAYAIDQETYGTEHPSIALHLNNIGLTWKDLNELKKSLGFLKSALTINIKFYGEINARVTDNLNNIGLVLKMLGENQQAVSYHQRALAIDEIIFGKRHPKVARDLNNLGMAWKDLNHISKANKCLKRAAKISKPIFGKLHPNLAQDFNNKGSVCLAEGKYEEAIKNYEKALQINEKIYGSAHIRMVITLSNISSALRYLNKDEEAMKHSERALKIYGQLGNTHPCEATLYNNLATAQTKLEMHDQAIQNFEKALSLDEASFGKEHPEVAIDLDNLSTVWLAIKDTTKALECVERAFKINLKIFGEKHPSIAQNYSNLASVYELLNKLGEAVKYFEKAYKIFNETLGAQHPFTKNALHNLNLTKQNNH